MAGDKAVDTKKVATPVAEKQDTLPITDSREILFKTSRLAP